MTATTSMKDEKEKNMAQGQMSFFDHSNVMRKLSESGDPLEKLTRVVDWNMFGGLISKVRV